MLRLSRALILFLLLTAPGAAMAQFSMGGAIPQAPEDAKRQKLNGRSDSEGDYTPAPEALRAISTEQARAMVGQELRKYSAFGVDNGGIVSITVGLSRLQILASNGHMLTVPLADAQITVSHGGLFASSPGISIDGNEFDAPDGWEYAQIDRLTDALYVLKNAAQAEQGGDTGFAQVVADYRAANPKPALPEEARRFEVQAKGAIQDGDFAEAAAYYGRALQIAPWWPGGHYNRAAVLVEIGEYALAISEMQHYLQLVPDAQDARASQDKIYDWERLENKTMTTAAPPGGRTSAPAK